MVEIPLYQSSLQEPLSLGITQRFADCRSRTILGLICCHEPCFNEVPTCNPIISQAVRNTFYDVGEDMPNTYSIPDGYFVI